MSARYDNPVLLYVEDEQSDVFFMQRALRSASVGWQLFTVPDGREAIAYLLGEGKYSDRRLFPQPQFVLLDLNLPLVSGFDVLAAIRMHSDYVNLPVVIFSSSGRPEDRNRANQLGANGYILKPSSGAEFNQTVSELQSFYDACDRIAAAEARRGSIIRI
jgi:CheY-like chemotaxis protein